MREVNPETITGTLSWYKILPFNGFNETEKSFLKFLEPSQAPKVVYTELDGIWEGM